MDVGFERAGLKEECRGEDVGLRGLSLGMGFKGAGSGWGTGGFKGWVKGAMCLKGLEK